jgi:hypothetical protein
VAAVASFFDPLGLIAPFIISAKILIQRLWKRSLEWDDPLPPDVLAEWHAWTREVPHLDKIWVPRCFRAYKRLDSTETKHRLILFCDASEATLGAAVYIRVAVRRSCRTRPAELNNVQAKRSCWPEARSGRAKRS